MAKEIKHVKGKTPHPWVSWSAIDMWHNCPMMYEARYYKKKKPVRTYYMRLGSAAHAAAHSINAAAMKGIELSPEDANAAARMAVKQEMIAGEITPGDWADMVDGLIEWATIVHYTVKDMLGAEIECRIPYSVDGSIELMVKIDAAFHLPGGGIKILDFKNSRKITKKDELKDDRQIMVYSMAMLERIPGLEYIEAGHWYFRHKSENLIKVDPAKVYHIREWIDQALEGITSGVFPARVNRECGRCDLRGSCKEYADRYRGIKGGRPKNPQDAHKRLDKLKKTIQLLEAEQLNLKEYMGERADEQDQILVESGSLAWYHRIEEIRSIPAGPVVELYSDHGVDLLERMTAKTTELDKATKQVIRSLPSKIEQDKFLKKLDKIQTINKRTKLVLGKPLPDRPITKKKSKRSKKKG